MPLPQEADTQSISSGVQQGHSWSGGGPSTFMLALWNREGGTEWQVWCFPSCDPPGIPSGYTKYLRTASEPDRGVREANTSNSRARCGSALAIL